MDSEQMKVFSELLEGFNLFEDVLNKVQPIPGSSTVKQNKCSITAAPNDLEQWRKNWVFHSCKMCLLCTHTLYRCIVCDDLYLCVTCYKKNGHHHEMEKLTLESESEIIPTDQLLTSAEEVRKLSLLRSTRSMWHARQCCNNNCSMPSCLKMKRFLRHTKTCKRKANGGCPICNEVVSFTSHQPYYCEQTNCSLPFCQNIKYKMKQQQQKARQQQAQLLRRRMAVESSRGLPTNVERGQSNPQLTQEDQSEVPGSSRLSEYHYQEYVGAVRSPRVRNRQALQELLRTLRSPDTAEQRQRILNILLSNPELMPAFLDQSEQELQNRN